MMTADPIFDELLVNVAALPEKWAGVASSRREQHAVDAFADGYERAAQELQAALDAARARVARLSPEQFGALPHIHATAQTVRRWCRAGELAGARLTPHGWEIPSGAARVPARLAAAGARAA